MQRYPAKENTIEFDTLRQMLIRRFGHEYQGIKSTDKLDFALYPEFAFLAGQMLTSKNPACMAFVSAIDPFVQENIRKIVYYEDLLSAIRYLNMLTDSSLELKTKYVQYLAALSKLQVQVATLVRHQRELYKKMQFLSADSSYYHHQTIVQLKDDIHLLMEKSQSKVGVFGLLDLAKKRFIACI